MTRMEHLLQRIAELVRQTSVEVFGATSAANPSLRWTADTPTKPGWYWHLQRPERLHEPLIRVVEVHHWESGVWVSETGVEDPTRITEFHGKWAGPLEPPVLEE